MSYTLILISTILCFVTTVSFLDLDKDYKSFQELGTKIKVNAESILYFIGYTT
jgi:hypothetical protein